MLRDLNHLHGRTAVARDGDIGSVQDIYFDDEAWGVRYLEIDTGNWTTEGRVLISPYSVDHAGLCAADIVRVDLTRQQVRDSPSIDTHKPVSRQHEAEYLRYYGYPLYWGGPNLRGMGEYPVPGFIGAAPIPADVRQQFSLYGDQPPGDVHLRSASHVERCAIEAVDGSIGHISGFIFDDEAWVIRYFVVDTRAWWPGGKEVLLTSFGIRGRVGTPRLISRAGTPPYRLLVTPRATSLSAPLNFSIIAIEISTRDKASKNNLCAIPILPGADVARSIGSCGVRGHAARRSMARGYSRCETYLIY